MNDYELCGRDKKKWYVSHFPNVYGIVDCIWANLKSNLFLAIFVSSLSAFHTDVCILHVNRWLDLDVKMNGFRPKNIFNLILTCLACSKFHNKKTIRFLLANQCRFTENIQVHYFIRFKDLNESIHDAKKTFRDHKHSTRQNKSDVNMKNRNVNDRKFICWNGRWQRKCEQNRTQLNVFFTKKKTGKNKWKKTTKIQTLRCVLFIICCQQR